MDCEATVRILLERMLHDATVQPTNLPISLLKSITNNFADDQQIGSGGFAVVYKGLLQNGVVAVKKLSRSSDFDEKKFIQELDTLMRVKHKNIVRFLGYCADTQLKMSKYEGKNVMAEERQRLLCFEFLAKGSLAQYITNTSQGLEWNMRYQIIKGICDGLHYLHTHRVLHLDLKPANILLNDSMLPKIADFGLSRCFDGNKSRTMTSNLVGTPGYAAPEFFSGVIAFELDIYSLGVIILEIVTGQKGYVAVENVLESWKGRIKTSQGDAQLEQIKACAEIGIQCIHPNPVRRPDTRHIIAALEEMERTSGFIGTDRQFTSSATHSMDISPAQPLQRIVSVPKGPGETRTEVDVYPLDIWFPLEPNEIIKNPVTLINKGGNLIGVCIHPTSLDACSNPDYPYVWEQQKGDDLPSSSLFRRLGPQSSETIYLTMRNQEQPPVQEDKGMFDVVMITTKSEADLKRLGQEHWNYVRRARDKSEYPLMAANVFGSVVHQATVLRAAVTHDPSRCPEVAAHQFIQARGTIDCMDVHPSKTWLLVGSSDNVSIWNYETQERDIWFQVTYSQKSKCVQICSIKFIAGEQWFAAGDYQGGVHVYAHTSGAVKNKVTEFVPHGRKKYMTNSLAVHPNHTLLLTASIDDNSVKLWDWSQGWTCARIIDTHGHVFDLKVGPRDTSTFATSTGGNSNVIKVWDIQSPDTIATFEGHRPVYTDSHQDFLVSLFGDSRTRSTNALIWNLQTKKQVHTLCPGVPSEYHLRNLASHPTLPILAGITTRKGYEVHQIVLWDIRTYRVMKRVDLLMEHDHTDPKMLFDGSEGITRLVVTSSTEVFIIKINVPTLLIDC